jgi:hypothetical protein
VKFLEEVLRKNTVLYLGVLREPYGVNTVKFLVGFSLGKTRIPKACGGPYAHLRLTPLDCSMMINLGGGL